MKNILFLALFCFAINDLSAQTYCLTYVKTELTAPLRVKYDWTITATVAVDASVAINGTGSLSGQFDVIGGSGTSMNGSFTFDRSSSDPYDILPNDGLPFGVTAQSNGAVATLSCVLPVDLIHFSATPLSKVVKLEWSTASEKNGSHFDIERSENGKEFVKIGNLKAQNTSVLHKSYTFLDEKPHFGTNYYRLKMVDNDAKFTYSDIKTASIQTDKTVVKVFPNPTSDAVYLHILSPNEATSIVKLCNANGQILRVLSPKLTVGDNSVLMDMTDLPLGFYFAFLEIGDKRFSMKISKN